MLDFNKEIRTLIDWRGMSFSKLADRAGLSKTQVCNVYHGHTKSMGINECVKLADALDYELVLIPKKREE